MFASEKVFQGGSGWQPSCQETTGPTGAGRPRAEHVTPPSFSDLSAEELWSAYRQLRQAEYTVALRNVRSPKGACLIPLAGARRYLFAIVDAEDHEFLSAFTWRAWIRRGYMKARAVTSIDGRTEQMSRLLAGVGHRYIHVRNINGNTLDNRKSNLLVLPRKDRCWLKR